MIMVRDGLFSRIALRNLPCSEGISTLFQAGPLTSGSSCLLRLPDLVVSDILQRSSLVTVAGPPRNRTGFPFEPGLNHLI